MWVSGSPTANRNGTVGGCELDGVVDEVRQELPQLARIAAQRQRFDADGLQRHPPLLGDRPEHFDGLANQFVQRHGLAPQVGTARFALSQLQQLIDELAEMPAFVVELKQQLLIFLDRARLLERDFDRTLDGRQRGSQLVRSVRHELTILFEMIGDLIEKRVDLDGELIEFVTDAAHSEALVEVTRSQSLGGANDLLQRLDGSPRHHQTAQRSQ